MNNNCFSIAFTGDISFSKYFEGKCETNILDSEIIDFLNDASEVVTNIEAPITNADIQSDRPLNHVNNPQITGFLNKINSRIWNLANNHIMDCNDEGLNDSIRYALSNDCIPLGVAEYNSIILGDDIKVALISVTMPWKQLKRSDGLQVTTNWNEIEKIKSLIQAAKKVVDWTILVIHAGEEFCSMPMPITRKQYKKILECGADVIVGHHPHVVQNYEVISDKTIFYSLGNFVFDTDFQRMQANTQNGVILKLQFKKNTYSWTAIATEIDREKMHISKTEIPCIFKNISNFEYHRLWPIAALYYERANRKALCYKYPNYSRYSSIKFLIKNVKDCKTKRGRDVFIGVMIGKIIILLSAKDYNLFRYLECKDVSE